MIPRRSKAAVGLAARFARSCTLLVPVFCGFLAGCGSTSLTDSLPSVPNIFGEKEQEKLPGRRISVLKTGEKAGLAQEVSAPVNLPPPLANASWSQPGGNPTNAPGHLVLNSALHTLWTADAGEGSTKRTRLTAIPIVYDNKVFTLDAEGMLKAISTSNGDVLWKLSLVPEGEKKTSWNPFNSSNMARAGFGGGIAADAGRIFVATGFGTVVALEAGSGKVVWTKKLEIPIRQAPSAAEGRVFIVNSEAELFCLSQTDGSELWSQKGLPEGTAELTSASPALYGGFVYVPYPSGEITAIDIKSGQPKWTEAAAPGDRFSSASAIGIASRPVVDRDVVFAFSRGGELIATSRDKGTRLWARDIAGSQMPWVAGDALFVVDVSGKLIALNRKDGKIRWITQLPGSGVWSGPVLGGGKLWLASSKGELVSVDASTGTISTQADIGAPVLIPPVVAEGRLYVLTDKAKLIAMN